MLTGGGGEILRCPEITYLKFCYIFGFRFFHFEILGDMKSFAGVKNAQNKNFKGASEFLIVEDVSSYPPPQARKIIECA